MIYANPVKSTRQCPRTQRRDDGVLEQTLKQVGRVIQTLKEERASIKQNFPGQNRQNHQEPIGWRIINCSKIERAKSWVDHEASPAGPGRWQQILLLLLGTWMALCGGSLYAFSRWALSRKKNNVSRVPLAIRDSFQKHLFPVLIDKTVFVKLTANNELCQSMPRFEVQIMSHCGLSAQQLDVVYAAGQVPALSFVEAQVTWDSSSFFLLLLLLVLLLVVD